MTNERFVLEVVLGDNVTLQFNSAEELNVWAHSEKRIWDELHSNTKQLFGGYCRKWWDEQKEYITQLTALTGKALAAGPNNATALEAVRQHLCEMELARPKRFLCTKVDADSFIKILMLTDTSAAAAGLLTRRGPEVLKEALEIHAATLPVVRDGQLRFQIAYNKSLGEAHKKQLEDTIKSIEEKRRLDKAMGGMVGHWRNRSRWALGFAIFWLIVLAILASAILATTLPTLSSIWAQFNRIEASAAAPAAQTLLAMAPFYALIAIPVIWVLRHISRLFIENLSDARDATLRATMAEAFVTMTENESLKPQKEERAVILAALFRAGATQPADDGVPLPLIELLKKG